MTFVMTNSITRSSVRAAAPPPESARMEAQCSQRGMFVGIPEHPVAWGGREARARAHMGVLFRAEVAHLFGGRG